MHNSTPLKRPLGEHNLNIRLVNGDITIVISSSSNTNANVNARV